MHLMPSPTPEIILENIKEWINDLGKLSITPHKNPKCHFSIWVSLPESSIIQPIMVTYPKNDEKILFGWHWLMEAMDSKAYHAITDISKKLHLTNSFRNEAMKRKFILQFEPDIFKLKGIAIFKFIPINELTKESFRGVMLDLMYMWGYLMSLFENNDMSRAGFNPSDYI